MGKAPVGLHNYSIAYSCRLGPLYDVFCIYPDKIRIFFLIILVGYRNYEIFPVGVPICCLHSNEGSANVLCQLHAASSCLLMYSKMKQFLQTIL